MQGAGAYQAPQQFRDLDLETLEQFNLEEQYKALPEAFPSFNSKERQLLQYESLGANLNEHYMNVNEQDLLEFLICALQKDKNCVELKLDEKVFQVEAKFKQDLGDICMRMSIF